MREKTKKVNNCGRSPSAMMENQNNPDITKSETRSGTPCFFIFKNIKNSNAKRKMALRKIMPFTSHNIWTP
jgi:hypothetical protein